MWLRAHHFPLCVLKRVPIKYDLGATKFPRDSKEESFPSPAAQRKKIKFEKLQEAGESQTHLESRLEMCGVHQALSQTSCAHYIFPTVSGAGGQRGAQAPWDKEEDTKQLNSAPKSKLEEVTFFFSIQYVLSAERTPGTRLSVDTEQR